MNQFLFDLQRFAATIRSSGVTNNSDGSITLSTNGNTSKTFTITVDGVTTTYTLWVNGSTTIWTDDNGAITLSVTSGFVHQLLNGSSAPNVTLKTGNGIFRPYFAQVIAFENSNAEFYFTTGNNNSNTLNVTDTTITVNGSDSNSREFVFGDLKYKSTQNISNVTISIDSSKNYSMNIGTSSRATLSYDKDSDFANTLTPTSGTITVKGDSDGNLYVTALDASDTFTIGDVTYTLSGVLLKATNSSSANKYYPHKVSSSTEIPLTALDFTSGELVSIYMAISGTLTISAEELDKLDEDTVAVADSNSSDFGALYGKLTKDDDTKTITLERTDEDDQYGAIVIEGDYNVVLSSTITNVPITVNNTSTTFSVTNTDSDFTVPSSVSPLTVGGATGLSLRSGTLLTSLSAQTIAASSYSVYGYNDTSSSPDGITVQRDGSTVIVGDIDAGESFSVSTASGISGYTMLSGNSGLLEQTNGVYKAYDSTGSVTLGSAGNPLIAPDGTGLEIGSTNTYSAAVFNSTSEPTTKYALLTADSGAYSLSTYSGDDGSTFQSNVSTISLLGGQTTIDKALVSNSTNIVTKTTTFLVTNVSGDTFVVSSGTATAPTISGATAITLQSGSITTTAGQTITLNGLSRTVTSSSDGVVIAISDSSATITAAAGKTFNIGSDSFTVDSNNTSGMTVTVTADTMTIAAGAGDSFTVGGETYTVGELSDGVTFAVDSTGKVTTISDLNTLNDAFNYNNTTGYSVMGAGFLREVSSVPNIWNKEGTTHSLTGGTVSVSDLNSTSNWLGLVIVQDDSITLSPSGTDNGLLIDEQYSKTYGTLIKGDNSYTITNTSNTDVALDNISINSGSSSFTLTVDDAFPNITISAPKADFAVTATNGDYQVTLTNDNMGLVNATAVSLVKGTLTADSLLSGGVLVDSKTFIPAQEVTVMTDSAGGDASIAGLSYGEKFSLNSNSYTFTGSGLRKADQLLRGSKTSSSIDNTLGLDSVTSDSAEWLGMIKASVDGGVSIKSSGNTMFSLTAAPKNLLYSYTIHELPNTEFGTRQLCM